MRADQIGLDVILDRLERASQDSGTRRSDPPTILRRLVSQGRLGVKSGQGFYAYPQPDPGWEESPVPLERRGRSRSPGWTARRRTRSRPRSLRAACSMGRGRRRRRGARARVRLREPDDLLRRRRHQGVHARWTRTVRRAARRSMHGFCASDGAEQHRHDRRRQRRRLRRRLRARDGAATSAWRASPRASASPRSTSGSSPASAALSACARLVGTSKALEMNLSGDPILADEAYELGLANRIVADHELFDTALAWARRFAGQAPLAVREIKRVSGTPTSMPGSRRRSARSARCSPPRTRRRASPPSSRSAPPASPDAESPRADRADARRWP